MNERALGVDQSLGANVSRLCDSGCQILTTLLQSNYIVDHFVISRLKNNL